MFSHYHRKCAERPHSLSERAQEIIDDFVTRSVTISSRREKEKEKEKEKETVCHLKR